MAVMEKPAAKKKVPKTGLKLDLGCGQRTTEGFRGVDIVPGDNVEFVVDLFQFPWPFADRSVREAVSNHVVEHIPHYRPEYQGVDGFFMFFNELHRICQKNAQVTLTMPHFKNERSFWDPTHTRYIHAWNFNYVNQQWLKDQALDHYPVTANFEFIGGFHQWMDETIATRNEEMQAQAKNYYWNVDGDMTIILKAIK